MVEHQQAQKSSESKSNIQTRTIPPKQIPISHPAAIIQRARINPKSLTPSDVLQLQRTIGNRAVGRLLSEIGLIPSKAKQVPPVQMQTMPEEEKEHLQGKFAEPLQRQETPEEEEPLQGKFENGAEKEICPSCIQRQEILEEGEPLQTKRENNTGMPDNLKTGVENLSGIDMSDVRVHYNSDKPAGVGALAYTQGTDIHVAPGQERHLPHEAWHVVQQAQGRVNTTIQLKKVAVNDDFLLEQEATKMANKALQLNADFVIQKKLLGNRNYDPVSRNLTNSKKYFQTKVAQRMTIFDTSLEEGNGDYRHVDQDRTLHPMGDNPEYDTKMQALNLIALSINDYITRRQPGKNLGPHIAVSVVSKKMFIAVNSSFLDSKSTGITSTELENVAKIVVDNIKDFIQHINGLLTQQDQKLLDTLTWVTNVGAYKGFGNFDERGMPRIRKSDIQQGEIHGEQLIMHHLLTDPMERKRLADRQRKLVEIPGKTPTMKRVIRIGGTLIDCVDCYEAFHGKVISPHRSKQHMNVHEPKVGPLGMIPYDSKLATTFGPLRVMSPGTSGRHFPGWSSLEVRSQPSKENGQAEGIQTQFPMPRILEQNILYTFLTRNGWR